MRCKVKAFTLAEVLVTLVIIGIVAALTVPSIMNNVKWSEYKTKSQKVLALLNQTSILWHAENGTIVDCGYWKKKPFDCSAYCVSYSDEGDCTSYKCKDTEEDLPKNYNGYFSECRNLYDFYLKKFNVVKVCNSNALANKCIPEYEGNDTVWKKKNNSDSSYDANKATTGCGGFRQAKLNEGKAFITQDGMIFIPYSGYVSGIMAVDVNGFKGPNKWGHDLRVFQPKIVDKNNDPAFMGGGCEFVEPGGKTTYNLLNGK